MKLSSRYKVKLLEHENKVTIYDLDLITLNVDVTNMSDAHPSLLRSCLYKQTATYYFIEALIHEIV